VLCSVDRLPFRPASVDAAVLFGTLHHLAEHEQTLDRVLATVRPGGYVGLDEVVARHGLKARLMPWRPTEESAHNEFVDPEVIRSSLKRQADIVHAQRLFTPVRPLMNRVIGDRMRSRPRLTRMVVGLDKFAMATLGRVWKAFAGSELLVLARRAETR
jgi:hypothetical protein